MQTALLQPRVRMVAEWNRRSYCQGGSLTSLGELSLDVAHSGTQP